MKLKIPKLSPAVNQIVVHMLTVFLVAFGTQLVAGATGAVSISSVLALLTSAAAAGGVAVLHLVIGLVPTASTVSGNVSTKATIAYTVTLTQVKSAGYQLFLSVVVTFVTILGSQLAGGAVHATSLPSVIAVVLAAISAAVAAVVQFLVGLVPAPVVPITAGS